MDQAEVTVGAEDDGEGLATCGRAMQRRTVAARSHQQQRGGGRGIADDCRMKRESR